MERFRQHWHLAVFIFVARERGKQLDIRVPRLDGKDGMALAFGLVQLIELAWGHILAFLRNMI